MTGLSDLSCLDDLPGLDLPVSCRLWTEQVLLRKLVQPRKGYAINRSQKMRACGLVFGICLGLILEAQAQTQPPAQAHAAKSLMGTSKNCPDLAAGIESGGHSGSGV
jgi:hypothetical protein